MVLGAEDEDIDYVKTVAATYLPNIVEVAKKNPLAKELLHLYAYFGNSDELPAIFFENEATYHILMPQDKKVIETAVDRIACANASLADISLIDYGKNLRGERVLETHEILRKAIRLHTYDQRKDYFKKAIEVFNHGVKDLYKPSNREHVAAIVRAYAAYFSQFIEMAKELNLEEEEQKKAIASLMDNSPFSFNVPVEFGSPLLENLKYVNIEDLQFLHKVRINQQCKWIENEYEQLSSEQRAEFDNALKNRSKNFEQLLEEIKQNLIDTASLNIGLAYLIQGNITQAETLLKDLLDSESLITKIQALNYLHIISRLKGDLQNCDYLDKAESLLEEIKESAKQGQYYGLSRTGAALTGMFKTGFKYGGIVGTVSGTLTGGLSVALLDDKFFRLTGTLLGSTIAGTIVGLTMGAAAGTIGGIIGFIDGMTSFDPQKLSQIQDQIASKIKHLEDVIQTNRNAQEPMKSKF